MTRLALCGIVLASAVLAQGPPKDAPKPPQEPPPIDAFAEAPTRGGEAPGRGFNPHMLGDYQGLFARGLVTVPIEQTIESFRVVPRTVTRVVTRLVPNANGTLESQETVIRERVNVRVPVTLRNTVNVAVPVAVPVTGLGSFKIAENESPMPSDRAFVTYNHFSDVRGPSLWGAAAPATNANRVVAGFERSFLDGAVSLGVRLPMTEQGDGFGDVGDVTAVVKYAALSDPESGSVLSVGLAVTAPTGPAIDTFAGDLHPTLLQPFVGYRLSDGAFFVQGFTSVAVPTQRDFPTLLFNDVGVGYLVYRADASAAITTVAPVVEAHLTTPLTYRCGCAPVLAPDLLVLVGGVQVGVFGPSTLTLGVGVPVTGPRPFDVEAIVQFNARF